ncbi:MAG: RNA polymerase sigma factor [bacterium]
MKESEAENGYWLKQYLETGGTQYWGRIYEKYKRQVFAHCLRMTNDSEEAKDLTSEAFVKAFENINTYDLKRPFFPWLCRIATNLCIDYVRRKSRIQFEQLENQMQEEVCKDEMGDDERGDLRDKIREAIKKLKRPQQRCFCLFYIQQKSYEEIAEITGYPQNAVRSHIQNGRRRFKVLFAERGA